MQDNSKIVADFLKNFETNESFNAYCFGLSKQRIQNFTPENWTSFLYGVNYLAKQTNCSCLEVVEKNVEAFGYMYSNYRPDKERSRKIKKFAYKIADKLASSPTFADFYFKIDVAVNYSQNTDQKAAQIMRAAIYKEFIGDNLTTDFLKPTIRIVNQNKIKNAGYYKNKGLLTHEVVLKSSSVDFCNTIAHELYHSLQHLGFIDRTKFLKKLGIKFDYDEKISELFRLNNTYYLNYDKHLKGYKKQPLEYEARLFATCFERKLRKNLKAAENNWSLLYYTTQTLRGLNIFDLNTSYSDDGIAILCKTDNEQKAALLGELVVTHLKDATLSQADNNSVVLYIPRNKQNIISINKLYTVETKSQKNNAFETEFVKKFFPVSYSMYYATNYEKNKHKPRLSKIIINRLGLNAKKR